MLVESGATVGSWRGNGVGSHWLGNDLCRLRRVIHVLRHAGCLPKSIPSFACQGRCSSHVQLRLDADLRLERSCMCCQEVGEREAHVRLKCAGDTVGYRRVKTYAPLECMCRPCA
ncbi:PREDICTED: bursicon-like [Priapulus caudatus]|uniref:Bursicon n=1 Tax=Priapulus caudatus TaxID=37621 RepID=A0ABM1E2L6_PRICU|nr:PREDICTED: bursicon-like [Priapulus caudatus]